MFSIIISFWYICIIIHVFIEHAFELNMAQCSLKYFFFTSVLLLIQNQSTPNIPDFFKCFMYEMSILLSIWFCANGKKWFTCEQCLHKVKYRREKFILVVCLRSLANWCRHWFFKSLFSLVSDRDLSFSLSV